MLVKSRWLTEEVWQGIRAILLEHNVYNTQNLFKHVLGMLWRLEKGVPWRALPPDFGPYSSVFNLFNRWSKKGIWRKVYEHIRSQLSPSESIFVDSTSCKVHQDAFGSGQDTKTECIGKSRGGNTTKLHVGCDDQGLPIVILLSAGNVADISMAQEIADLSSEPNFVADKGYDSDALRNYITAQGRTPIIPTKSNSSRANPGYNEDLYKQRRKVENFFCKIKSLRAVATRYEKTARNFASGIFMACASLILQATS